MNTKLKSTVLAGCLALTSVSHAFAQDVPAEPNAPQPALTTTDRWTFSGAVYGWLSGIDSTTQSGDSVEITFSDIIDNLDMVFMGGLAAEKGKWTLFSDLIYLDQGTTNRTTANVIGVPAKVKTKINLKSWINTTGAGYSAFDNGSTQISGLAGFRYLRLKTDLDFDIGPAGRKLSGTDNFFDGIVGFRGKTNINENWYLTYYADVGTGQSDLTYQLFAGVNYRFKKWDAVVGYRYMDWDLGNDAALSDLTVKGPLIGARFRF
ncbi:porin family protein [Tateyamaria pelophila]|uniref:hypothetical protein n=1 Tax=Tateyamaria pelophila TaxID=328415 RepID=UPI001CBD8EBD|nr:hypothetical protein [Tateyamaria pelophila]